MKIAFIVGRFPCLSETFVLNQITGLIDRGHEVDIYAYGPGKDLKMHADVEKYNLLHHTFYYGDVYQKIPANKFRRFIKGLNLIIKNIHRKPMALLKSLNIFKFGREALSLFTLYSIIPFLDKDKYDIVHCHFGPNGNLGALLKETGVFKGKLITAFHGYDMTQYIEKNGENVYNHLFKKGDLFLPISKRWKDKLIKIGCDREKIIVHRMGINIKKFLFHPRKHGKDGKINLLTIARLVEKKGVQYGIQAVAQVLKRYPWIEYRIIGDGPLKTDLENLIKELNIGSNVKLLGWKQHEEIVTLMEESDILLAPSVTSKNGDQEGIPVVIMEALAQGLPVISTYHSGIPELVEDGVSGFLVPEHHVDSLANRLAYLIDHPEIWPEMGKAGRKHVEEYFNIDKLNDQLVKIYQQLLN